MTIQGVDQTKDDHLFTLGEQNEECEESPEKVEVPEKVQEDKEIEIIEGDKEKKI